MLAGLGAINARDVLADAGQSAASASAPASTPAAITYDAKQKTFHLRTPSTSYILQVLAGGMLAHVYWGRRLQSASWPGMRNGHEGDAPPAHADLGDRNFSPNTQLQEFPGYGTGDLRRRQ
jgi:alpha-galactosidase